MGKKPSRDPDDLQHLLPAIVRSKVAAVPIRSLNLGIVAFSLIALAAGIALGGWMESGLARSWVIGGLVVGALIVRAISGRQEAHLLRRISRWEESGEIPPSTPGEPSEPSKPDSPDD